MKKAKHKQTKSGAATFNSLEYFESKKQRRVVQKTEDNGGESYKVVKWKFLLWVFTQSPNILHTAKHWLSWLLTTFGN